MILNVYSVYDKKAQSYLTMFCRSHDGEALRSFADDVSNANSPFAKHPEDYSLYKLGQFNSITGELIGHKSKPLSEAVAFVSQN
jgi:hypothetical protein